MPASSQWAKIAPYAVVSLVSFLLFLILLFVLVLKAEVLVALGLTGNLFYVALVPLGLFAALVLFGVQRSYAHYKGRHIGGVLELGGPVVVFLLVILGGFMLVPSPRAFALTVYVHGPAGRQDLVLRNEGHVILDLGGDRRREKIGDKGEAYFRIPPEFRGQRVPVGVESEAYETAAPSEDLKLDTDRLYLRVRRKSGHLTGRVQDREGNAVPGASIQVAGVSVSTGPDGRFEISIPGERMKPEFSLTAAAGGYATQSHTVVANANEITIILQRN
jgi:hypothetical protein